MKKTNNLKYILHFSNGTFLKNFCNFNTPIPGYNIGIATTKYYQNCLKFNSASEAKEIGGKTNRDFKVKPFSIKPIAKY